MTSIRLWRGDRVRVLATGGCFDRSVESAEAVSERRWSIGLLCDPLQKFSSSATVKGSSSTTNSRSGLRVRSELDRGQYPGGVTVTDAQLATVRLDRHRFHGDWNYTIYRATRKTAKSGIV